MSQSFSRASVRRFIYLCAPVLLTALASQAQSLRCDATGGVPPIVRAEGRAELVGDIYVVCDPTPVGTSVTFDLEVKFNAKVTSKLIGNGFTEALLLIDTEINPTLHEPYFKKVQPGFNAFQGKLKSPDTIVFERVTLKNRFADSTQAFRVTNMRADATAIGLSATPIPNKVTAQVSAGAALAISRPTHDVAFVLNSFSFEARTANDTREAVILRACVAGNPGLLAGTGVGSVDYRIRFTEMFQTAFKAHRSDQEQNMPGVVYNTESGFFDPSLPALNGFSQTGMATQGTRLRARFNGIPPGVKVFVTTNSLPAGQFSYARAALVAADSRGAGPFSPLPADAAGTIGGVSYPLRSLNVANGSADAVWEVVGENPSEKDIYSFGIALAHDVLAAGATFEMRADLAPTSNVREASGTEPIPRFDSTFGTEQAHRMPCSQQPNLIVESISLPPAVEAGGSLAAIATIRNFSNWPAAISTASFGLYSDSTLSTRLGSLAFCTVPQLEPGASHTCRADLTVPASSTGALYYVRAAADSAGAIAEASEIDNARSEPASVVPCETYLRPTGALSGFPSAGGAGIIEVVTRVSCQWTLRTDSFIKVDRASGTGPATVNFTMDPNPTSDSRKGFITTDADYSTMHQASPHDRSEAVALTLHGSGRYLQPHLFVPKLLANGDPVGVVNFLISPSISGLNACLVEYTIATKTFRLMTDNGAGWLGPVAERSENTLVNRQCTLRAATSFAYPEPGTQRLFLTITIQTGGIAGQTQVHTYFANPQSGASSGWQSWDTLKYSSERGPIPLSLSPLSGEGGARLFTASFQHRTDNHYLAYLLLLPTPNVTQFTAKGSCLVEYNRISHGIRLIDDAGTGWLGPISGVPIAPAAPALSNSLCSVDVASAAAEDGPPGVLTIRIPVKLKPALGTQIGTFTQVFDVRGNYSGMQQFGTWSNAGGNAPSPGPGSAAAVTSIAGRIVNVDVKASHTSGLSALAIVHVRLASAIIADNPCHIVYFPKANTINLIAQDQTRFVGTDVLVGSSAVLTNAICSIDVSKVAATQSGKLGITLPVQFAQPGQRNLYANAFDIYGLLTHWVDGGTFALP